MYKKYQTLSLRVKVVLSMTMIIVLYSIIFIFITVTKAEKELFAQLELSTSESVAQFDNYLDTMQADLINISSLPYANEILMDIIRGKKSIAIPENQTYVYDFLLGTTLFKESINFSGFVSEHFNEASYYTAKDNSFGLRDYQTLKNSPIFSDFISSEKNYGCYRLPAEDTSIITQNQSDKLLFLRTIRDPQEGFELMGYMLIGIDLSTLTKFCDTFMESSKNGIIVLDKDNSMVYQNGLPIDKQILSDEKVKKNTQYLISSSHINQFNWKVYYYTTIEDIPNIWFSNSVMYVILIALAAISVFVVMANILTSVVTSPLKKLLASMQKSQQGDFEQQVPIICNDEIGQLTAGYNQMILHIKQLIEQNYAIKLEEKRAELGALQAQINPHFLYNTLDLLYWKSSASGQKEMAQNIYSLSRLFRLSLNKGDVWIRIEKETEFLTHYLTLQKAMLSDKLTFEVTADSSIQKINIPRFIIQPFVENSIVHGFRNKIQLPRISVSFRQLKSDILILIEDNGCGMKQTTADILFSRNENLADSGYAVKNVINRLALYFGQNYELHAFSSPGEGTQIRLTLLDIMNAKE